MKRILFITSRNIFTTCGEIRLIKNRAEAMYNYYRIPTDFLAIAKTERINAPIKENIEAGGSIKGICTTLINPISVMRSLNELKKITKERIMSGEYGAVVLSGTGPQVLAKTIRKYSNIKIIVDCHGASETTEEALRKYSALGKIWHRLISRTDRFLLKKGFRYFDACFVVSPALKEYLIKKYNICSKVRFFDVPCATTQPINIDDYERYREEFRHKYEIDSDEKVFIYSGGVSSWQCIEETVDLYKSIRKTINTKSRFLIFSHMRKEIQKITENDNEIMIDSYSPEILERALCAGDYAFLLRRKSIINTVAFPNKYLEYVKSGMKIITTPYINEIARQVEENGIGYIYDFDKDDGHIIDYIKQDSINKKEMIKKAETILEYNGFKRRLQEVADYIMKGEN